MTGRRDLRRPVVRAPVAGPLPAIVVALFAIAASIVGIRNDFVFDDIAVIRDNPYVHALYIGDMFRYAYWPPPFVRELYQPVTEIVLALEYTAGHGAPLVFRLVSYALYALCAVLAYRLALRLVPPNIALAIGCLFAVHPVHVEAVALGVNQAELIVAACCLIAAALYIDRRRSGRLSALDWLIIALLYAVAVLAKENGAVLPLLLVAADLTILRTTSEPVSPRMRAGGYAVLAAILIAYLAVRARVLSDLAMASVPVIDLRGLGVGGRMLVMLQIVPQWLRLLAWPHHLQVDFAPGEIARPGMLGVMGAIGVLIVIVYAALLAWSWTRSPRLAFALLWLGIALVPVSNFIPTGVLLAERTLFLPSVGFVLGLGIAADWLIARAAFGRQTVRILVACAALLLVLGVVRSANRQSVWNSRHVVRRLVRPGTYE